MEKSLKTFRDKFLDFCLEIGWKHWAKLGVSGRETADKRVNVDPEALILLTGFLGDRDLRLIDNVAGWLVTNESLVYKTRLKTIIDLGYPKILASLGSMFERANERSDGSSWISLEEYCLERINKSEKLEKTLKQDFLAFEEISSAKSVNVNFRNNRILLRKLFGTSTRAELLNFFIGGGSGSSKGIAEYLHLSQSTVHTTLKSFMEIGLVKRQGRSRNTSYRFIEDYFSLEGLQPEVFFGWGNYFRSLILAWKQIESLSRADSEYKVRSALNRFYLTFLENLSVWNESFSKAPTPESQRTRYLLEVEDPVGYLLNAIRSLPSRAAEKLGVENENNQIPF